MHIAVVHGYLLRGTGSNLYVQNLCREFCRLGHEVSLFCQEDSPRDYDFVSGAFDFPPDNSDAIPLWDRETSYGGKCSLYRPHLGGLLPVYVYDHYAGFTVKEFTHLSLGELDSYIEHNRRALASVFKRCRPELALSQHTIMQPVYTARALRGLEVCPHFITAHGSALNFSVRRSTLLEDYAREGIAACDRIICVSQASQREFVDFFSDGLSVESKSVVIPVGVDTEKFTPLSPGETKRERAGSLISSLPAGERSEGGAASQKRSLSQAVAEATSATSLAPLLEGLRRDDSKWAVDGDAADRLSSINWEREPVVIYYGKLLWTKGAQLLLAAAPVILEKHPHTRFILAGFGSQRPFLEALVAALEHGKRELITEMTSRPDILDPGANPASSRYLSALIQNLDDAVYADEYFASARGRLADRVIFTGYLDHDRLSDILPCAEIAVAPSIFPEAFGLVAVESLAAGIIPLLANHSGFQDVIREVVEEFSDTFDEARFEPLFLNGDFALNLAGNISAFLDYYGEMDEEVRQEIRWRARDIAVPRYSWGTIARSYLDL
jgi:glycosyltransferase involved in cell wall biosynthesis